MNAHSPAYLLRPNSALFQNNLSKMYRSQITSIGFVVLQLLTFSNGFIASLAKSHLIPSSSTGFSSEAQVSSQHSREDNKYHARAIKEHKSTAKELSRRKRRCIDDAKPQPANLSVVSGNKTVSIDLLPKSGDATYYATGLGACGMVSTDTSMIAAVSHLLFDTFPGATANPNLNPICGRKVIATYQGKSVEVEIVDRCTGCAIYDLDFSPSAFQQIGILDEGRLHGMTWHWS